MYESRTISATWRDTEIQLWSNNLSRGTLSGQAERLCLVVVVVVMVFNATFKNISVIS